LAQFIMLVVAIIAGKLVWDMYNDYQKKMQPAAKTKSSKKKHSGNGEVIDLSNAWINMNELPYRKQGYFLSGRELALYQLINDVLQNSSYTAFPRVNLADIITVAADAENRSEYVKRIKERNVDILICERDDLKPVLFIIINGIVESRKKQQILEDRFMKNAAGAAGMDYIIIDLNNTPDKEHTLKLLQNSGLNI